MQSQTSAFAKAEGPASKDKEAEKKPVVADKEKVNDQVFILA